MSICSNQDGVCIVDTPPTLIIFPRIMDFGKAVGGKGRLVRSDWRIVFLRVSWNERRCLCTENLYRSYAILILRIHICLYIRVEAICQLGLRIRLMLERTLDCVDLNEMVVTDMGVLFSGHELRFWQVLYL